MTTVKLKKMEIILKEVSGWPEKNTGLFVALCLSVAIKFLLLMPEKMINSDGIIYVDAARHFAMGDFKAGLAVYPMPVYSLMITFVHFIIPDWIMAARIISTFSMTLAMIPLYFLTRDLFDAKAAFWACIAFALSPLPNDWAGDVLRGPVFLLFFSIAVYFSYSAIRREKIIFFFLSVFFSWFFVLLRIEGIIFIPFFIIFLTCLLLFEPWHRIDYIKGGAVWILLPATVFGVLYLTMGQFNFNRIDQVLHEIQKLFRLEFLKSYNTIYDQLKNLEQASPYPGGRQNFAEISRHFMPLIYLIGLLESFATVLFPFFVIPLFAGLKSRLSRGRVFILALVVTYLLMLYYSLIVKDFTQNRMLLAPAFLLYPWIGSGLVKLFDKTRTLSISNLFWPKLFVPVFIFLFAVTPVLKIMDHLDKEDITAKKAGEWLAENIEFSKLKIITNDSRIKFYAGKDIDCFQFHTPKNNYLRMANYAFKRNYECMIIRLSAKKKKMLPEFKKYEKIKEFSGKKNIAAVFCSKNFLKDPAYNSIKNLAKQNP